MANIFTIISIIIIISLLHIIIFLHLYHLRAVKMWNLNHEHITQGELNKVHTQDFPSNYQKRDVSFFWGY